MLKFLPILLVLAVAGGTARAEPLKFINEERPTARVSYADLNLGSEEGAETLRRRVMSAARSLCGNGLQGMSVGERRAARACLRDSARPALAQAERLIAQWASQHRFAGVQTPAN